MSYGAPKYEEEFLDEKAQNKQQTPEQIYHPLLNVSVPKGVEYIQVEDPSFSSGWGEALIKHTGLTFLLASVSGGIVGLISVAPIATRMFSRKLRLNTYLNGGGLLAHAWGNQAAAVVLSYHLIKKLGTLAFGKEEAEPVSYMVPGAIVGGLWNITGSPRAKITGMALGTLVGFATFVFTTTPKRKK